MKLPKITLLSWNYERAIFIRFIKIYANTFKVTRVQLLDRLKHFLMDGSESTIKILIDIDFDELDNQSSFMTSQFHDNKVNFRIKLGAWE